MNATVDYIMPTWRKWLPWCLLGVFFLFLIWALQSILAPFLLGAVLAYFGDPIVDWLEKRKLSRSLSVTIVFLVVTLVAILATLLLVPVLIGQAETMILRWPEWLAQIQQRLGPILQSTLGVDPSSLNVETFRSTIRDNWGQAQGVLTNLAVSVGKSSGAMLALAINAALIPVVTFYLLRDWDLMVAEIHRMIPRNVEPVAAKLARESDEVLGAFMLGQFLVMVSLAVVYSLGLWMIGLEFALLIGLLAGMVSFVPYMGSIVGAATALLAMWFQTGELLDLVWVLAVFGTGQVLEGWVLTPWLVGDRIGLHPVAVIFAVMAGGQLFGFIGVLIGLPAAAVLVVMLRYARDQWLVSEAYRGGAPPGAGGETDADDSASSDAGGNADGDAPLESDVELNPLADEVLLAEAADITEPPTSQS